MSISLSVVLCLWVVLHCILVKAQQCSDPYLAVCLIAKDEPDIAEWLEYHKRMGVSKFYIFDHNSSIPLLNDIHPYVRTGLVEYRFIVGEDLEPAAQLYVFQKCLKEFGHLHTFMAFIDVDEFIVVKDKSKKIPDILRNYEDFGGLVLNWRMIGNSGHIRRPEGGVLKNYHKCGNNAHIKSIVMPRHTITTGWASHSFTYVEGKFATDTPMRSIVYGPFNPGDNIIPPDDLFDVMYINHYAVKSLEDYDAKIKRGRSDVNHAPPRDMELFEKLESWAPNDCEYLEMPEDTGDVCIAPL